MDLKDKIAIVTGASSGIGYAIAHAFVDRGATVYAFARTQEKLEATAAEMGPLFKPQACDVRVEKDILVAVERVTAETGRVDVLVNNAGLGRFGPVDKLTVHDWDLLMDTNLRGVFLLTAAVTPVMKKQNAESGFGGHIVNIASIAGLVGNPNLSAYNASKFGLRGFSESLMLELRNDGIKVTCVYPGSVQTNFDAENGGFLSPNAMLPTDVAETVVHIIQTRENYLISEVVMRPLRPKGK